MTSGPAKLRAVGLITERYGDETAQTGSLTWTGSDWAMTGEASWLLTDFYAILPGPNGVREVKPSDGPVYLYAVWRSVVSTYFGVRLFDADGTFLDREELLAVTQVLGREESA